LGLAQGLSKIGWDSHSYLFDWWYLSINNRRA
jgi:hypothetical protein